MDNNERIEKVLASLLLQQPFFGVFASMLNIVNTKHVPTMATDGKNIYYSDDFVNSITNKQLQAVILHEINHCIYYQCDLKRIGSRNHEVWNIAADFEVNAEIMEMGKYELPKPFLYDKKYLNWTVEKIYDDIIRQAKENGVDLDSLGENFDTHMISDTDREEINEKILTAHEASKNSGDIPGKLQEFIKKIKESKVQWEKIFHRYIGSAISDDDYSYTRPNRRHICNDMYLPSIRGFKIGDIVVIFDTSGSIANDDLEQFIGELKKISGLINEVTFMTCDTMVHDVIKIHQFENVLSKIKISGRGGTDFRPAFKEVKNQQKIPELLIFLTDTYGDFPEKDPGYPVLWVSTVNKENAHKPPFGKIVYMK